MIIHFLDCKIGRTQQKRCVGGGGGGGVKTQIVRFQAYPEI